MPKNASPDRWRNTIHQVILKDGDRMLPREEIQFPRLECNLRLNGDGKLVLIHPELGLVFRSWSKDDDGPHYAALENGQLRCYRGTPKNPEVVLWQSPKPKKKGDGPYQLGITADKRLIIFQGDADSRTETVWKSPIRN